MNDPSSDAGHALGAAADKPMTSSDGPADGTAPSRRTRRTGAVLSVAAASCVLATATFGVSARDDDYITYWVAEQLAKSGRIVNINGSHVEQSSSLAHVVLLAVLYFVTRAPLPVLGYFVGVASFFIVVWLGATLAGRLRDGAQLPAAAALGLAFPLAFWSTGGLETTFAAAAMLAFCATLEQLVCRPSTSWRQLAGYLGCCLLVVTVRPDTMVVAVAITLVVLVAALIRARGSSTLNARVPDIGVRAAAIAVSGSLGASVLLAAFRLVVFHSILPQPELAKAGGLGWFHAGFSYVFSSFPYWIWLPFLALLGLGLAWGMRQRSSLALILGSTFIVGTVAIMFTRGDWMGAARLLCPYLAPGIIVMVIGAWSLAAVWRRTAFIALIVIECVGFVLLADGTAWFSSSYSSLAPSASTAIPADFGSPFGASVTVSNGRLPSLPWYTSWDFVHTRDAIFLANATPVLRRILATSTGRLTLASFQAGMVAYTWQNDFPGRLRFIDTDNIVANDFGRCHGLDQSFAGQVISFPQWVRDAGRCAPPLPDLLFSLDPPSYTPGLLEHYHVVSEISMTYRRRGLFTTSLLSGTEFLAVRDGWHP